MGWLDGNGGWAPSCPTARGRLSVAAADGHVSHRGPNQTSTWLRVVGILCAVNRPRTTLSPPPPPLHDWGVLESRKCGQAGSPPAIFHLPPKLRSSLAARNLMLCVLCMRSLYTRTPRFVNFTLRATLISTWQKCAINRRSLLYLEDE